MTPLARIIISLAIIAASIALGWCTRIGVEKGALRLSASQLNALRSRLQTTAIFILLPMSAMLSLWGLPDPEPGLLLLPLLGLVSYIAGGILALGASHMLKLDSAQTGSMFCCGTFTNIGAVGGLVCLLMAGENSIALVALYRLLEELYYFGVAFPVAQWFGSHRMVHKEKFRIHPALPLIICALLLGMLLNYMDFPRPEICGAIASVAMISSTVFFLYAIGLSLRISAIGNYWPPATAICAIKFVGVPFIVIPLAQLAGYGAYAQGLPLKVVAILCSMPVAMTALVPPSLFHLDIDLANSCWIVSTMCLVLVLPVLMAFLPNL